MTDLASTVDRRDPRGVGPVFSLPHRMAKLTTDAYGRIERTPETGHVVHWRSCTFYCSDGAARSSWGYRVECLKCGSVDECSHGSSVSSEDGPPRFAWEHRNCVGDHEPSRRGLIAATGLLPVDHPQLWTGAELVRSATRRHYARLAGERWAQ